MKGINTYILEKLKITSKNSLRKPNTTVTYLDFYNKIQKYCKSNGCKNVTVGMFDRVHRPEFLYDDNFKIYNIWPVEDKIKKLVFRISNVEKGKIELRTIEVTNNEDDLVDFITPEWVDKIMKCLSVY